ncbi:MAG: hypothetical protein ACR2PK_11805, partial [Acidimicrobiales bacterium]
MASSDPTVWVDPRIHGSSPTLWSALERVFPVRLTTETDASAPIGKVVVDGYETADQIPTLSVPLREHCVSTGAVDVRTTADVPDTTLAELDLTDCGPFQDGFAPRDEETVLARIDSGPVWVMATCGEARTFRSARPIAELGSSDALVSHLTLGDFLGLVPIVQALRSWLGAGGWSEPPLRATFLFDDINLHGRRYGYIPFEELVVDAKDHGYHTVMATIPLDAWYAHPTARELFA